MAVYTLSPGEQWVLEHLGCVDRDLVFTEGRITERKPPKQKTHQHQQKKKKKPLWEPNPFLAGHEPVFSWGYDNSSVIKPKHNINLID